MPGRVTRVLDENLAKLSRREGEAPTSTKSRKCTRPDRRPSRERKRPMPRTSKKRTRVSSIVEAFRVEMTSLDASVDGLAEINDPYQFQKEVENIKSKIQAKKSKLVVSEDFKRVREGIISLELDQETIRTRLTGLEGTIEELTAKHKTEFDLVTKLSKELENARFSLNSTKNLLYSAQQTQKDSFKEQSLVERNLTSQRERMVVLTEQRGKQEECINLLKSVEEKLAAAEGSSSALQEQFLTQWENWTPEQMAEWICSLDPAYACYRTIFNQQLSKQVESGADFQYFTVSELQGLGVGLMRHRHQIMAAIRNLISTRM